MKFKLKKILSFIFLILGIIMLGLGIFNFNLTKKTNMDNNQNNLEFRIVNFHVDINTPNNIKISFNIVNSETLLKDQNLKINFYENSNIVYTYEYSIDELEALGEIKVETNLEFDYTEITKYEFVIDNTKLNLIPFID